MDDGKSDHPVLIISPPHSRNDVDPALADFTPISISTDVLANQVKFIDDSGNIPIIFASVTIFYLKNS